MRPYGSKRTLGNCRTTKHNSGKIHVHESIKNHKFERKMAIHEFVFETAYDAVEFATECGQDFVRYTGSSWGTEEDGDYGVLVEGSVEEFC